MNKPIFLALTDKGIGVCPVRFALSLVEAVSKFSFQIMHVNNSNISMARDTAANAFLETDLDYLMFIDLDIIFTPAQLGRLFQSEHDIICGLYFLKNPAEAIPCFNTLTPGKRDIVAGEVIEVARAGTGFMRIHRNVFETMRKRSMIYGADHSKGLYHFFPQYIAGSRYVTEDWAFCDRARELGFMIMLDTGVQVGHEGRIIYPIVTQTT